MNKPPIRLFDVTEADASTFLQNQLTQDVALWTNMHEVRRAAWCTAKGRMFASFYIWRIDGGYRLVVSADMADKTVKRLMMYVLRAKVTIQLRDDLNPKWCLTQVPVGTHDESTFSLLSVEGQNYGLQLAQQDTPSNTALDWNTTHVQAGVAWVCAANSEQFIPQSVNFELVGGVNFRKGCYPGQEIVARSQYLGKLRRRGVIASFAGTPPKVMADVFKAGELTPESAIGQVVLVGSNCVLFECPQEFVTQNASLCVQLEDGAMSALKISALPYIIQDITK